MNKVYLVVKIDNVEIVQYINPDYRIVFDEFDNYSRFKTMEEAEENIIERLRNCGGEWTILTIYST